MYLLDTNILSDLIKKRPNPYLLSHLREKPSYTLLTSSICVMELRFGSALREDFEKFWKKIESEIISSVKVLPFGQKEALLAGDILANLRKIGQIIGVEDVLIAATAIANPSTVVTGNVEHFSRIQGLNVENWLTPLWKIYPS